MASTKCLTSYIFCHVACIRFFHAIPSMLVTTDNDNDISHDASKILPVRQNDNLMQNCWYDAGESEKV